MEQILSIKEVDLQVDGEWGTYSGFEIGTDNQAIKLLIQSDQLCCERWGYFMSEDDIQSFVGSHFLELKITDNELKEGLLEKHDLNHEYFEGSVMFVDIETTNGTLQFVAYNAHNGYYGHQALIISEQLNHEERL